MPRKFAVSFFVAGVFAIPDEGKEYEVELRIAGKQWVTGPPIFNKSKYNRFNATPTKGHEEF